MPQTLMATQAGKLEEVVAGKGGPMEVGQLLSGAHFPVQVHSDHIKHSDDKKGSGAIEEESIQQRWTETPQILSKPSGPFPNRSRKTFDHGHQ